MTTETETETSEPDLHALDPRELEPTDYKHAVVLLKRGESPLSRDQLEKIVFQQVGEHPDVIVHFLYGGRHEDGGLYPSLTQACSPPNKKAYRPKYWHVEEPYTMVPDEPAPKLTRISEEKSGSYKMKKEAIENPTPGDWEKEEKKTIKKMREILIMGGNTIEPWFSP